MSLAELLVCLLIVSLIAAIGLAVVPLRRRVFSVWRHRRIIVAVVVPFAVVLLIAAQFRQNAGELVACTAIVTLAVTAFAANWRRSAWRPLVVPLGAGSVFAASWLGWQPHADELLELKLPRVVERDGFVSSDACRACHPGNYASWHDSFHRTMTQVASPDTVRGPFDDVRLENRGRSYHLQRRDDEFWVTMPDADWEDSMQIAGQDLRTINDPPIVTRRVVLVTGSHHMQNYWVTSVRSNELYMLPFCYHLGEQRWFPSEDSFLKPPEAPRSFSHWNSNCIRCHSLAGNPGLDPATIDMRHNPSGILTSEVVEFGISCEACHGPAAEHIALHRNPLNRLRSHGRADPTIVNPARCSSRTQSEICAQCHSNFVETDLEGSFVKGLRYHAGDELAKSHRVIRYASEEPAAPGQPGKFIYWNDGACCVGGDEYNGLVESPCYQRGALSCLSCHSMHHSEPNDQLTAAGHDNRACTQCHQEDRFVSRLSEHTHHAADSGGSQCYNCHMPHTSYALLTAMRSHRIDSPDVGETVRSGRPNACNLCHLDQTLAWTSERLTEWYDAPPVTLTDKQRTVAASLTGLLEGNALQRVIVAWHMGWEPAQAASGRDWQAPFLAQALDDSYAAVRFVAEKSLRTLPDMSPQDYDFVGPPQHRAKVSRSLLNSWRHSAADEPAADRNARLLIRDGMIDLEQIASMVEQQDQQAVTIPE